MADKAGGEGTTPPRTTTPVTADQVSALQLLVAEQARQMKEQKKAFDDFLAAKKAEEAAAKAMKNELADLQGAFDRLQAANPGGGRGAGRGGGGGAGGPGAMAQAMPINAIRMDACPTATKEQSMREWTKLATRWSRALPTTLTAGEGRFRVHTAIAAGLNGKPRVKTAWDRLLEPYEKKYDDDATPFPDLVDLFTELKENVVEEEKIVAQEEFKFRDMNADESYSEYKMALFSLGGVGYDEYSEEQLSAKVLERFLAGCGEAGPSVRLQAPKSLEEAITKAIAFDNEKTRNEKSTVYAFSQGANHGNNARNRNQQNNNNRRFQGTCFVCKKRGHKSVDCWSKNNNNNNNTNNNNNNGSEGNQGDNRGQQNNPRPPLRCFVCNQPGHRAFQCPNRQGQNQ